MNWFRSHFYIFFEGVLPIVLVLLGVMAALVNSP